jgi:hypothetical protein
LQVSHLFIAKRICKLKDEIIKVHKKDIARSQLETAVSLFLLKLDYSSVITLAGASGGILHQLVLNEGKKPFADFGREIALYREGVHLPRKTYKYRLEILLGIIALKHMSDDCDDIIALDLEASAFNALTYVLYDYVTLFGQEDLFVKAFYNWVWENKNGVQIMEEYKDFTTRVKK